MEAPYKSKEALDRPLQGFREFPLETFPTVKELMTQKVMNKPF